jgi:hypothetical protein
MNTPRTDAAWEASFSPETPGLNMCDLARTLERELGAFATERDQLRAEVERFKEWLADPHTLHAHCLRTLTDGQIAHLFGERMTEIVNRAEKAEAQLHALRLVCGTTDANKFETWTDRANARAERAEAALTAEREKAERYRLTTLKLTAELAAERARAPGPRLAPQSPTKMRPN